MKRTEWLIVILALVVLCWIVSIVESAASADIEKIKLYVQVATLIVLISSVIFLWNQVALLKRQMSETQAWNKKRATRDMAVLFMEKYFDHTKALYDLAGVIFSDSKQTYETFLEPKLIDQKDAIETSHHLCYILGGFEEMAAGIRHNIYDNDIARDINITFFHDTYRWAGTYIERQQYTEIMQLYKKWQPKPKEDV